MFKEILCLGQTFVVYLVTHLKRNTHTTWLPTKLGRCCSHQYPRRGIQETATAGAMLINTVLMPTQSSNVSLIYNQVSVPVTGLTTQ